MTYESVAEFAATYGLVYLFVLFLGVLAYAFWPKNKKKFEEAARRPLEED
ncbi:cbb3-type cytochrome c oxidase subunit 3 [Pelagibius sp.]|nr:cbb3-type cytochrome c oxidase subunit 3 [Pelagibius sp.]